MDAGDLKAASCRTRAKFRQYLTAFVANIAAFCIGTMLGWTSPMQPLLSSDHPPVGSETISKEFISWLGSINFIGALIGTLFWGILSDRLGRKRTATLVAIPFIISWILVLTAQNRWWLLVARIVVGVGCSGVIINVPIYVAEMAENHIRGSLGSFLMIFLNAGCVFSYVVGSLTSYQGLASACLCLPIIFLLIFPFFPESPAFLWAQGKRDEAERSLLWFRGGNVLQTVKEIEALKVRPGKSLDAPRMVDLFSTTGVKKATVISIGFMIGQNLCGILGILTYTVKIFQNSGSSLSPHSSMIVVGCLQLSSALMSSFLVDRAGRRVLLISSYLAMTLSLITLGGYLYLNDIQNLSPVLRWIPICCLSINVISYSIGVGPVPFVVMSEIFPPDLRGYAASRIAFLGTFLSFLSVKTFPFLTDILGYHGCFLFYATCCALLAVFTYVILPETKGKTLQAILQQLNGKPDTKAADTECLELFNGQKKATIVKTQINA